MKNTLDARVEFDFKGQHHVLRASIDLDRLMQDRGGLPDLHALLAKENDIDVYSYEYEMMEAEAVCVDKATGLAAACVRDDRFDADCFEQRWREQRIAERLQEVAGRHLRVDDLSQHPELRAALLAAYRLGLEEGRETSGAGG